jgi:hypothetical protein
MASSPRVLHPSVHTHREPRISAAALAQYLILRPKGQQNILHDSKYSRPPIITANGEAMRALRAYNKDPKRPKDTLLRVKAALTMKAAGIGIKPKAKDEALRCVEIIGMFELAENAMGMRAMALSEPPKFESIEIEGVTVSIHPDLLVSGGARHVGAAMFRVAKAPDPTACKTDEAKDRRGNTRRELARYLVAEMQILLEAQDGELGIPDRDLCFVADVRLGERIGPAADHAVRVRDIRGACQQISKLWAGIEPNPSLFKPK